MDAALLSRMDTLESAVVGAVVTGTALLLGAIFAVVYLLVRRAA